MYFGEYLVSEGIASASQVVNGLIRQMREQPNPHEVLLNRGILKPEELLQVIGLQSEKRLSFEIACRELQLWSDDASRAIREASRESSTPLGVLLAEGTGIEPQKLVEAFDGYLANHARSDQEAEVQVLEGQATSARDAESEPQLEVQSSDLIAQAAEELAADLSAAEPQLTEPQPSEAVEPALNSASGGDGESGYVPKFYEIDASSLEDFMEILDQEKIRQLISDVEGVGNLGGTERVAKFLEVNGEIRVLQGTACFFRAKLIEKIAEDLNLHNAKLLQGSELSETDFNALKEVNFVGLNLILDIRESVKSQKSEEPFWSDSTNQSNVRSFLNSVSA